MILTLFSNISTAIKRYMEYRRTVSELNMLTNRDLQDLGINRCDIEFIAWNASNGGRN
jgi:uncharacterized protein YjiS (DUF1127 family)